MRAAFRSITNSKEVRMFVVVVVVFILLFCKELSKICNFGRIILELKLLPRPLLLGRLAGG